MYNRIKSLYDDGVVGNKIGGKRKFSDVKATERVAIPIDDVNRLAKGGLKITSITSTTPITGGTAVASGGVSSAGGGLTLKSSHTDGAKTASLTYVLDWDGNLDETITVSGSNKVGDWTASGSVSYTPRNLGCSSSQYVSNATADNGSTMANAGDNGTVSTTSASASATAAASVSSTTS